jgi:L-ascorbate metabolism protein UlaG (beta-lactamase superfamily)
MYEKRIDRRTYLKKMAALSKGVAAFSLFPSCSRGAGVTDSEDEKALIVNYDGLSLKEYARKKLHHGMERFLSPFESIKDQGGFTNLFKWKFLSDNKFKRFYNDEKVVGVSVDWDAVKNYRGLSATFLKHSTVLIKDDGKYLLVDPVFYRFIGTVRDFTPLDFDVAEMPAPDHVLITHGHRDHLDFNSLRKLSRDTHLVTPLGYDWIFKILRMKNRTKLDWYESYEGGGFEITLLPCNHWTMRDPIEGPNRSLWGSYLVKTASGGNVFVSGDTAYFDYFKEIGEQYKIDLAIVCLGAYEPRWFMKGSHMDPKETVRAFKELNAERLMVIHWGTFRLGDEPVYFPPLDIEREMEAAGLSDKLVKIAHGETLFL